MALRTSLYALLTAAFISPAFGQDKPAFPPEGVDLTAIWWTDSFIKPVPGEKFGPVRVDTNIRGDHTNPILQPWAAAKVKENADLVTAGTPQMSSMQRCQPLGVPRLVNIPYPFQILQEKDLITIVYNFDNAVRWIYMNQEHPKDLKKTWLGHSVGRWEGDTLVVDTVGLNDKTWIDSAATPHTDQLHVIERYRLIDDGKRLELTYTVEDPGAFTTVWSGRSTYTKSEDPLIEFICADNNREQETAGAQGIIDERGQ